jgi:pilus assembly protein CpaE
MNTDNPHDALSGVTEPAPAIQVPHISIAAFCAVSETADILRRAAADRRMSRASMEVETGGIPAAIEAFQAKPTPAVLIVECPGQQSEILAELAQLADVCQPETKVIVVGRINDITLYRELMLQGVSEYIIAPFSPVRLIETVAALYKNPKSAPLGKTIAFIGARGGAGSSTLAHNTAWALARLHRANTVIADFDLAFGTAGLDFNEDIANGILDALSQPDRIDSVLLDRLLVSVGDRLSLLASAGGVENEHELNSHAAGNILSALRENVPFTVADLPKQWSPWVKSVLLQADHVVITATPELASLRNARGLSELLKSLRPNDPPPLLVLNQADMPKRPEINPADFGKAAGLAVSAVIAHDPQAFGAALNRGKMIFDVAPRSKAAEAISRLAQFLAGPDKDVKKTAARRKSLFSFLRKT